jgi:multisubunit Na+/H+ antiporter MnhB subunit
MNTKFLSYFVAGSIAAMILGFALDGIGFALFCIAAGAMIAAIAATDYAPRPRHSQILCRRNRECLPFAA